MDFVLLILEIPKYVGCFKDNTDRDLELLENVGQNNTIPACIKSCYEKG